MRGVQLWEDVGPVLGLGPGMREVCIVEVDLKGKIDNNGGYNNNFYSLTGHDRMYENQNPRDFKQTMYL